MEAAEKRKSVGWLVTSTGLGRADHRWDVEWEVGAGGLEVIAEDDVACSTREEAVVEKRADARRSGTDNGRRQERG